MATILLDILVPILKDIQRTRFSELASSIIIIYDHLITIDQEVQHIWRASWTIGKVLFLINRYYTLFVVIFNNYALFSPNITDSVRLNWFRWQGWTGLIACAIAESKGMLKLTQSMTLILLLFLTPKAILQLRLYALYYGNKKVLALMVCSFVACMATSATIMGLVLSNVIATSHILPIITFCVPLRASHHFYAFWIPILAFETLLCSLALFRGYRSYKDNELRLTMLKRKASRHRSGRGSLATVQVEGGNSGGMRILEILLRDSLISYIIMFATYLTTTVIWILGPLELIEIPVGFTVAMSCVVGNRLLLNLRGSNRSSASSAVNFRHSINSNTHIINTNISNADADTETGLSHNTTNGSRSIVADTIEEERVRDAPSIVGEYELYALRSLKHKRSV